MKKAIIFLIIIIIASQCVKSNKEIGYQVKILRNNISDTSLIYFHFINCDSILPYVLGFNDTIGLKLSMDVLCNKPICPSGIITMYYSKEIGFFRGFYFSTNSQSNLNVSAIIRRIDLLSMHQKSFRIVVGSAIIPDEGIPTNKRKLGILSDTLCFLLK